MCTYATVHTTLEGSAKGFKDPWHRVSSATVYFDHPVHARGEHTLNIDLSDPENDSTGRVAIELSAASARQLVQAIETTLSSADHLI